MIPSNSLKPLRENSSWREYQKNLHRQAGQAKNIRRVCGLAVFSVCILAFASSLVTGTFETGFNTVKEVFLPPPAQALIEQKPSATDAKKIIAVNTFDKAGISNLLKDQPLENFDYPGFDLLSAAGNFRFETSIDPSLQNFILGKLKKYKTGDRGKPEKIGIVVMNPATGRIIAMAGMDDSGISSTSCTMDSYPAASIFKIVTATAAIEKCGLRAETRLKFNGGKYTLYKRQLKDKNNRHTNRISFKNSFAQSVNPIFGKIGCNRLGREFLSQYANAFSFNQEIEFELPLDPSIVSISEEPYQWAEIACGFNRKTKISPIFGALLGSTVVNSGIMVEPSIIQTVKGQDGRLLYETHTTDVGRVMRASTAKEIKKLMNATITSGTGKKSFRGYKRDRTLSKLNIGGKTGSIYNDARDIRFDWFVGFAEEKKGSKGLALGIVVGHGKYIGTRAARYGRQIMKEYFKKDFASRAKAKSHKKANKA